MKPSPGWKKDSLMMRGKVLGGPDAHWCNDWDGLPINAWDVEYDCCTEKKSVLGRVVNWFAMKAYAWSEFRRQRDRSHDRYIGYILAYTAFWLIAIVIWRLL